MVLYQKLIMKGGVVRHTSNCGGAGWRGVPGCSSHIGNRGPFTCNCRTALGSKRHYTKHCSATERVESCFWKGGVA